MCVCTVPPSGAAGRAGGFPVPLPRPRAGLARAARVGPRSWVLRGAGVPGACVCVLDCKGKWLTAPFLLLLPFPVLSGAEWEDGVSERDRQPPHPHQGALSAPGTGGPCPWCSQFRVLAAALLTSVVPLDTKRHY